jgi:type III secretion protein C
MKGLQVTRWFHAMLMVVALLWAPTIHAATPAGWKDTGFSINANGMMLRDVLEEFGRVYAVRVSISAKADMFMKGRLKADSGNDFLDRLTQPYKFRWFVYNDTLYIVPRDDNASMRLNVGEDAVQDAKAALVGLGLFDNRFGWGELPDEGLVIVSGPRAYVNLVRDVLLPNEGKAPLRGKHIMVFRLKYASATDRVITTRGKSETIPGVRTILSSLLFGPESSEKLAATRGTFDVGSSKRSREPKYGKGSARDVGEATTALKARSQQDSEEDDSDRSSKSKSSSREERPRIEADPSLNAIMIYDNVNKRDMYKALIAELDIEPQQIEIEALIVDIDRSKLSELGAEWGVRSGNVVSRINNTKADSQGVDLPLPGATLLISNAARFYMRLKALEGTGQARVLAKPTVLTLDNVAAVLDLSQTQYVPLVGERIADLANVTAGTMLRVVPRIVREGDSTRVRLEVDIEDGSLGDPALKTNVTRSTISTQAIIDLQQTLMIGGYHAEAVSNNQQKVPLLGDVPLFGNLFRNDSTSHSSRERLFLITPRLSDSTGVAAAPRSRASRLARKYATTDNRLFTTLPQSVGTVSEATGSKAAASVAPAAASSTSAPVTPVTPVTPPAPSAPPAPPAVPAASTASAAVAADAARKASPGVRSTNDSLPAPPETNVPALQPVRFKPDQPFRSGAPAPSSKGKCARPKASWPTAPNILF